jgi:DNA-binding transcriptional LysR family regulator
MDLNWDDLKVLLALARGGSVAGAARELKVDHSTVSRRLAAIEEGFGAQLLVRGGREFTWTTEGKIALATAEETEKLVLGASRQLRACRQEVAGTVRVATTPSILAILANLMPAFQVRYPRMEFEFIAGLHRVDLAKGVADVAVRFARPTEPDLVARQVGEAGIALYASKTYVRKYGAPESFEALARHRLVLLAEHLHRFGLHMRWLEDYRDGGTVITRVDNFQSAEQLISLDRGIGSLPCYEGDSNSALQRVFQDPHSFAECYVVYHVSLRDNARVKAAVEVLTAVLGSVADKISGDSRRAERTSKQT